MKSFIKIIIISFKSPFTVSEAKLFKDIKKVKYISYFESSKFGRLYKYIYLKIQRKNSLKAIKGHYNHFNLKVFRGFNATKLKLFRNYIKH